MKLYIGFLFSILVMFPDLCFGLTFPPIVDELEFPSLLDGNDIQLKSGGLDFGSLLTVSEKVPDQKPVVRVYISGSTAAGDQIKKHFGCVPELNFVVKEPEAWINRPLVLQWQGENGQWWTMGNDDRGVDLVAFVKEYNSTFPSKQAIQFDVIEAVNVGYPIHSRGTTWSVASIKNPTAEQIRFHLLYEGKHRGKFTKSRLDQMSWKELRALHDDDHENKVKWASIKNNLAVRTEKKTTAPKPSQVATSRNYEQYSKPRKAYRKLFKPKARARSGCPGGVCPL